MGRGIDRRDAIKRDSENRKGDYAQREWYLISDEALPALGISRYEINCGEKGSAKTHYLHIIPPDRLDGTPIGLRLYIHFNVGSDESAFLCPTFMKTVMSDPRYNIPLPPQIADGRCPVCEKRQQLRDELLRLKEQNPSGDFKALENEIKELSYSMRYLLWVIDAKDEKAEAEGLKFVSVPKTVYEGILDISKDRRTGEIIDITDPDTGKVFLFDRAGDKQYNTEYKTFAIEDRQPLPDEWLVVLRYTDVLKFHDYQTIRAAFYGGVEPAETAASAAPQAQTTTTAELAAAAQPTGRRMPRVANPTPVQTAPGAETATPAAPSSVVTSAPAAAAPSTSAPTAATTSSTVTETPAPSTQGRRGSPPPAETNPTPSKLDEIRARIRARSQQPPAQ